MMAGAASGEAEKPPFIRIDRDDRNAWEKPLDNLRIITDHRYQFKKLSSKDDIDPDTPVLAPGLYSASTGKRVPFTDDYTIVEKAGRKTA